MGTGTKTKQEHENLLKRELVIFKNTEQQQELSEFEKTEQEREQGQKKLQKLDSLRNYFKIKALIRGCSPKTL